MDDNNSLSVIDAVVQELNSEFGNAATLGPRKCLRGMAIDDIEANVARDSVAARMTISAYYEGLHDDSWTGQKTFDVTLEVMAELAETAPRWKKDFTAAASRMSAALQEGRDAWYAAGLPARQPVRVMKPLRLGKH